MQDFKVGDRVQWLQRFDEVEYPVQGTVEMVEEGRLTVRDNLGQFWQVEEWDEPKLVWD
jgi:hypothetical protein